MRRLALLLALCLTMVIGPIISAGAADDGDVTVPRFTLGSLEGLRPDHHAQLRDGLGLLNAGRPRRAQDMAASVLADDGRVAAAWELVGAALAMQGDLGQAREALEKAVFHDANRPTAWTKLGDIHLARGDGDAAAEAFRAALRRDPAMPLAHRRLGLLAEHRGAVEEAVTHYEQGLKDRPRRWLGVKVNLARLYNLRGQPAKARALLEGLVPPTSDNPDALIALGAARLGTGAAAEAVGPLSAAINHRPAEPRLLYLLGAALHGAGRFEEAIEILEHARDVAPDSRPARRVLAAALMESGRFAEAAKALDALVKDGAAGWPDYRRLAKAHTLAENPEAAITALRRATEELDTPPVEAFLRLAEAQDGQADEVGALGALEAGLKARPGSPRLLRAKARLHARRGEVDDALAAVAPLTTSPAATPADLLLTARLQAATGQRRTARNWYKRIIAIAPESAQAEAARAELEAAD